MDIVRYEFMCFFLHILSTGIVLWQLPPHMTAGDREALWPHQLYVQSPGEVWMQGIS